MSSTCSSITNLICHRRWIVALCLIANFASAAPIDEFRISDLEQKVRELESASREQARVISQLQGQTTGVTRSTSLPTTKTPDNKSSWLSATNWERLKPGMSELQVIELLGPPTQIKLNDPQTRSMLYALEIGRSGFLVGKVELRDNKITAVEIPRLK